MKSYWIAYGGGTLAAVVGGVLWVASEERFGAIIMLAGITIAIIGLIMNLVEWAMNKGKRPVQD